MTNTICYCLTHYLDNKQQVSSESRRPRGDSWEAATGSCLAKSCWILLNPAESCWILLNPAKSCWILLNPAESCWILLNPAEVCLILLNPAESWWVLLNPAESCWILQSPAESSNQVSCYVSSVYLSSYSRQWIEILLLKVCFSRWGDLSFVRKTTKIKVYIHLKIFRVECLRGYNKSNEWLYMYIFLPS